MPEIAEVQVFQKAYEVSKSTENALVSGPKSEELSAGRCSRKYYISCKKFALLSHDDHQINNRKDRMGEHVYCVREMWKDLRVFRSPKKWTKNILQYQKEGGSEKNSSPVK